MQRKLNLSNEIFFLIEDAFEKQYYEDEVILWLVIRGKKYLIEVDSYKYEMQPVFQYFCDVTNYTEIGERDLGLEYFKYQSYFDDNSDLHQFDKYLAFSYDQMALLFYKRNNQLFCQVTENIWGETFSVICEETIDSLTLLEWEKVLR